MKKNVKCRMCGTETWTPGATLTFLETCNPCQRMMSGVSDAPVVETISPPAPSTKEQLPETGSSPAANHVMLRELLARVERIEGRLLKLEEARVPMSANAQDIGPLTKTLREQKSTALVPVMPVRQTATETLATTDVKNGT